MIVHTYWTFLLLLSLFVFVYYNVSTSVFWNASIKEEISPTGITVTKIVAYSLKKTLELDGEIYNCNKTNFDNIEDRSIQFDDQGWKRIENSDVYVLSVNLDNRLKPYTYIRIISVIKGSWNQTVYCQIITTDGQVQVIKSTVTPIWFDEWDMDDNNIYYNPTLISCRLPIFKKISKVFLSTKPCQMPMQYHKLNEPDSTQRNFTVCIKPLLFKDDIFKYLIQWFEINKILGADHFYIFYEKAHMYTEKLLKWYASSEPDMFDLKTLPLLDNAEETFNKFTWQRRRYEIVAYNECFYKNLNSKYVVPLDVDEVIVPKTADTWFELVRHLDVFSSLMVRNVYFFVKNGSKSDKSIFFRYLYRTEKVSAIGENSKSFISTKNALTIFNHYSLHSLKPGRKEYFLPFKDVQLNHYKESCDTVIFPECLNYLSSQRICDRSIFKYRSKVEQNYLSILNKIMYNFNKTV
ncbi:hypothetical protein GWI33_003270 [Rhynchophorus ferrugineus]|uniref:Glycosyltransferase family 92 protein n=1 Tax=Rhynchophorus ferrugineus TaxID=354439 RepID=A0A834MF51_RHYFE|nr:hypothetical protein GWI33_003270 [Rhynchophorus ferrugineus]